MKSSREVDELVATKVMGYTTTQAEHWGMWKGENVRSIDTIWVKPGQCSTEAKNKRQLSIPSYSADISAAWSVLELLRVSMGAWTVVDYCPYYGVTVTINVPNDKEYKAEAGFVPLAICLAALEVVKE